jgi:hypothetical protein
MAKELTRAQLEELYLPPSDRFVEVDVPRTKYFMVDGRGDPHTKANGAVLRWLFAAIEPARRLAKERMGKAFVAPPLECLWTADDPADLAAARKERLDWCMMIPAANWMTATLLKEGVTEGRERLGDPPETLRFGRLHEGRCVQIMHVGPNAKEAATLRRLYRDHLPANGLVPSGPYHEIYLNDPRRTAPERLRTVLRQPVRPCPSR